MRNYYNELYFNQYFDQRFPLKIYNQECVQIHTVFHIDAGV